jgi:hypothetical protein
MRHTHGTLGHRARGRLAPLIAAALAWLGHMLCALPAAGQAPGRLAPRLLSTLDEMVERPAEDASGRSASTAGQKTTSAPAGPPPSIDGPEELPDVAPRKADEPRRSTFAGDDGSAPIAPPLSIPPETFLAEDLFDWQPPKLKAHRNGFFQKLSASGTWLYGGTGADDIGLTDIETFGVFALPFPIVEWPLVITPGYNLHLLSGPESTDAPPRLHDAYVDFMWLPTFVHRWTMLLSVTPGYYSDLEVSDSDAFRLTGKGLVIYDWHPQKLQLVGGVLYLGRDNLKILPAGGAIWRPTDDFQFDLIFPKPKLAVRINDSPGFEDWIYGTAEYGGNTYVVERVGGAHDKLTYQDFRLLVGYEHRLNYGAGVRFEAGYVFGRQADFLSGSGDFAPPDTILLRAGIAF